MGCFNKFALFVLNFIVFGVGVAVVVLASLVISKDSTYGTLLASGTFTLPIIILIAGLIILLLGFLGCCGALKESSCMLQTYAAIVLILLIAEIVMGILLLVYSEKAEKYVKDGMMSVFEGYGEQDKALMKAMDIAQHDLHCCGVNNYTDWESLPYGKTGNVSEGCCKDMDDQCNNGIGLQNNPNFANIVYNEGCFYAIKDDLQNVSIGLGVTCIVLAVIQLMAISCACGIAKKSKRYA